jgi:hypothetical protein
MVMGPSVGGPSRRVLVAVGLIAACTLAFQVLLTRLLSAVMAYHFSFLAVSLALTGTGAGALLVYLAPQLFAGGSLERHLARWGGLYSALLFVTPFALVRLDFTGGGGVHNSDISAEFVVSLAGASLLAALPSIAAGVVIALAINGYTSSVGRVYAFDLVGAGAGALLIVPLMWVASAPVLLAGLGAVALVATLLFAPAASRERVISLALAAAMACVSVVAIASSALHLPPRHPTPADTEVSDRWNPLSRVVAYDMDGVSLAFYDRDVAPVIELRDEDEVPDWERLRTGPQSIGYELTGPGRTLIIGGGGGRDIYNALSSGQEQVDVIELNEGIRRAVDEDLAESSGSPYSRERVSTTVGDGRGVLAARDTLYDTVHIGFTNTLSANSAAGYALTENNLYTVEAFQEYLDHLTPDGVLNVSRVRHFAGDEALRATVIALAALEREGIEQPERNVVVVAGNDMFDEPMATILARLRPYTDAELETVRTLAAERGGEVVFAPGGPYGREWSGLGDANWRDFCRDYRYDVCPSTDDKPFFFNQSRLSELGTSSAYTYSRDPFQVLMVTLGVLVALAVLAFVLPLRLVRRASRPTVGALSYFAAIGLGFLLLEIVLIQRFVLFLGFPTYALSVVLFALLVFSGLGSALSARWVRSRRALMSTLGAVIVLAVFSAIWLQPVLRSLITLPFPARVAVAVAVIAPLGLVLGTAMPAGLVRFKGLHPDGLPYAWGVNGVASVLASVLGVALAVNFGFAVTSLVAAACYVGALAHARLGRWPDPPSAEDPSGEMPDRELVGAALVSEPVGG